MCHNVFGKEFREAGKKIFAFEERLGEKNELTEKFLIFLRKGFLSLCESC